jgi:glyoxylase-like metal-dependent hydrolase (beta-lactamase superfamily II)
MKIIPLSEGSFTIDKTKVFVPFESDVDDLQSRSKGSLLVEVQPFVVVTKNDVILLDTGLGFSKNGELNIYQNLKENNIEPDAVTKVLMTHLHKDHAGGVSIKDRIGNYSLAFKNATYYVQQKEMDYAFEVGFPSYMPEELSVLENNSKVVMLDGDGEIEGFIRYEVDGGHCPYHQSFWIKEDDQIIFFGGDNAPQLQQMKSKLAAKYDFDGKRSRDLRQDWWETGRKENWQFLFYHDIKTPVWPSL